MDRELNNEDKIDLKIVQELLDVCTKHKLPPHEAHGLLIGATIQIMLGQIQPKNLTAVMEVGDKTKTVMLNYFSAIGWE